MPSSRERVWEAARGRKESGKVKKALTAHVKELMRTKAFRDLGPRRQRETLDSLDVEANRKLADIAAKVRAHDRPQAREDPPVRPMPKRAEWTSRIKDREQWREATAAGFAAYRAKRDEERRMREPTGKENETRLDGAQGTVMPSIEDGEGWQQELPVLPKQPPQAELVRGVAEMGVKDGEEVEMAIRGKKK